MRKPVYKTCKIIFISTLSLYLLTLAAVPYVGVYLTYGAIPIIILSGLLAYWLDPKEPELTKEKTPRDRILEIDARIRELDK